MTRKIFIIIIISSLFIGSTFSCDECGKRSTQHVNEPFFEVQKIFENDRFPNVVVATDGTVIVTWGTDKYQIRRSEDGGETWGDVITIAEPGFQGGGTIVDDESGDILAFVEEDHPPSPLTLYRSTDNGVNWTSEEVTIHPDKNGNVPSMHMNETGITLKNGPHAGRLIRPTRFYGNGNDRKFWETHYTNAIYSDDGGQTWYTSDPFPANGTGEAALAELSDGRIYYNSRRHLSTEGLNPRMRHIAWSEDGGELWKNLTVSNVLPDGAKNRDYGLMAGLVRLPIEGHDILLYSNIESYEGRTGGTVWASFDGGESWPVKRLVDEGSFAYSSMAAGRAGTPSEGQIYLLYESEGGAKIARFNLNWVTNGCDWREFLSN